MSRRNLLTTLLISIIAVVVVFSLKSIVSIPSGAFLSDTEKSSSNSFKQALISDILSLTPGTARATYVNRPGPFPLIASLDNNGKLSLDFGQIKAGNSNSSSDVFRIKNLSSAPITLSFSLSDNLAGIFESVGVKKGYTVSGGETVKVDVRIKTTKNTPKQLLSSLLTIKIDNYNLTQKIPVKIEVM